MKRVEGPIASVWAFEAGLVPTAACQTKRPSPRLACHPAHDLASRAIQRPTSRRVSSRAPDLAPRVSSRAPDLAPRVSSRAPDLAPRVSSRAPDLAPRVSSRTPDLASRVIQSARPRVACHPERPTSRLACHPERLTSRRVSSRAPDPSGHPSRRMSAKDRLSDSPAVATAIRASGGDPSRSIGWSDCRVDEALWMTRDARAGAASMTRDARARRAALHAARESGCYRQRRSAALSSRAKRYGRTSLRRLSTVRGSSRMATAYREG